MRRIGVTVALGALSGMFGELVMPSAAFAALAGALQRQVIQGGVLAQPGGPVHLGRQGCAGSLSVDLDQHRGAGTAAACAAGQSFEAPRAQGASMPPRADYASALATNVHRVG